MIGSRDAYQVFTWYKNKRFQPSFGEIFGFDLVNNLVIILVGKEISFAYNNNPSSKCLLKFRISWFPCHLPLSKTLSLIDTITQKTLHNLFEHQPLNV